MHNKKQWTVLAVVALLGLIAGGPMASGAKKEGKKVEAKKETAKPARSVNFAKDLGLEFNSLTTLGTRISAARAEADPVCLASLGQELAAAEKVSGKTASITSADLLKEAAELAKIRFNPNELKAVSYLAQDKSLLAIAQKAEKAMQDNMRAREAGESTRGIQGTLHVDSRVPGQWIRVYIDGRFVGNVSPYGDSYFYIGQTPWETTFLYASTFSGTTTWSGSVSSAVGDYVWTLYP
jgi:hypothetical protein